MKKLVLSALLLPVFLASGCASSGPESQAYSKEEWCREYNTTLTINAEIIKGLAENNVKFTPDLVDRVIGIANSEYELAFNGGVVLGEKIVQSRGKANEIIQASLQSIQANSEQTGPVADLATRKDYLDMLTQLEELAKSEGYASLDEYVEDYSDTIESQCGYDIGEIVTGEKTA